MSEEEPKVCQICSDFEPQAWRKSLCRNCFHTLEEHSEEMLAAQAESVAQDKTENTGAKDESKKDDKAKSSSGGKNSPVMPKDKKTPSSSSPISKNDVSKSSSSPSTSPQSKSSPKSSSSPTSSSQSSSTSAKSLSSSSSSSSSSSTSTSSTTTTTSSSSLSKSKTSLSSSTTTPVPPISKAKTLTSKFENKNSKIESADSKSSSPKPLAKPDRSKPLTDTSKSSVPGDTKTEKSDDPKKLISKSSPGSAKDVKDDSVKKEGIKTTGKEDETKNNKSSIVNPKGEEKDSKTLPNMKTKNASPFGKSMLKSTKDRDKDTIDKRAEKILASKEASTSEVKSKLASLGEKSKFNSLDRRDKEKGDETDKFKFNSLDRRLKDKGNETDKSKFNSLGRREKTDETKAKTDTNNTHQNAVLSTNGESGPKTSAKVGHAEKPGTHVVDEKATSQAFSAKNIREIDKPGAGKINTAELASVQDSKAKHGWQVGGKEKLENKSSPGTTEVKNRDESSCGSGCVGGAQKDGKESNGSALTSKGQASGGAGITESRVIVGLEGEKDKSLHKETRNASGKVKDSHDASNERVDGILRPGQSAVSSTSPSKAVASPVVTTTVNKPGASTTTTTPTTSSSAFSTSVGTKNNDTSSSLSTSQNLSKFLPSKVGKDVSGGNDTGKSKTTVGKDGASATASPLSTSATAKHSGSSADSEKVDALSKELKVKEKRVSSLESSLEKMEKKLKLMEEEKAAAKKTETRGDKVELEKSLQALRSQLSEMQTQCVKLATDNSSLTSKLQDQEKMVKECQDLRGKTEENEILERDLELTEKELDDVKDENSELQREIMEMKNEMDEMYDTFRENEQDEFRELQKELDMTAKNCRILQFKLRKAERRNEQIEEDRMHYEEKLRHLQSQFDSQDAKNHIRVLEEELRIAKEVSVRLHDELDIIEDKKLKAMEDNKHLTELLEHTDKRQFRMEMEIDKLREMVSDLRQQLKEARSGSGTGSNSTSNHREGSTPDKTGAPVLERQTSKDGQEYDVSQLMRDLCDTMERENDLKDQLKFTEDEAKTLRRRVSDMDEENENLRLQLQKMSEKASKHKKKEQQRSKELEEEKKISEAAKAALTATRESLTSSEFTLVLGAGPVDDVISVDEQIPVSQRKDSTDEDLMNVMQLRVQLEMLEQELMTSHKKMDEMDLENENLIEEVKFLQERLGEYEKSQDSNLRLDPSASDSYYEDKLKELGHENDALRWKLMEKEREVERMSMVQSRQTRDHPKRPDKLKKSKSLDTDSDPVVSDLRKQLDRVQMELIKTRQRVDDAEERNEHLEQQQTVKQESKGTVPDIVADGAAVENIELKDRIRCMEAEMKAKSEKIKVMSDDLQKLSRDTRNIQHAATSPMSPGNQNIPGIPGSTTARDSSHTSNQKSQIRPHDSEGKVHSVSLNSVQADHENEHGKNDRLGSSIERRERGRGDDSEGESSSPALQEPRGEADGESTIHVHFYSDPLITLTTGTAGSDGRPTVGSDMSSPGKASQVDDKPGTGSTKENDNKKRMELEREAGGSNGAASGNGGVGGEKEEGGLREKEGEVESRKSVDKSADSSSDRRGVSERDAHVQPSSCEEENGVSLLCSGNTNGSETDCTESKLSFVVEKSDVFSRLGSNNSLIDCGNVNNVEQESTIECKDHDITVGLVTTDSSKKDTFSESRTDARTSDISSKTKSSRLKDLRESGRKTTKSRNESEEEIINAKISSVVSSDIIKGNVNTTECSLESTDLDTMASKGESEKKRAKESESSSSSGGGGGSESKTSVKSDEFNSIMALYPGGKSKVTTTGDESRVELMEKILDMDEEISELLSIIRQREDDYNRMCREVKALRGQMEELREESHRNEVDLLQELDMLHDKNTVMSNLLDIINERAEAAEEELEKRIQEGRTASPPRSASNVSQVSALSDTSMGSDEVFQNAHGNRDGVVNRDWEAKLKGRIESLERLLAEERQKVMMAEKKLALASNETVTPSVTDDVKLRMREKELLQEELLESQRHLHIASDQIQGLKERFQILDEEHNRLKEDYGKLHDEVDQPSERGAGSPNSEASLKTPVNALEDEDPFVTKRISVIEAPNFKDLKIDAKTEVSELKAELAEYKQKAQDLECKIEEINDIWRSKSSASDREKDEMEQELRQKTQDITRIQNTMKTLEKELCSKDKIIAQHDINLLEMSKDLTRKTELSKEQENEVKKMADSKQLLESHISQRDASIRGLNETIRSRDDRLKEKDDILIKLRNSYDEAKSHVRNYEEKIRDLTVKVNDKDALVAVLKDQISTAKENSQSQKSKEITCPDESQSELKHVKDELEMMKHDLEKKKKENSELQQNLETSRKTMSDSMVLWRSEKSTLQRDLNVLEEKVRLYEVYNPHSQGEAIESLKEEAYDFFTQKETLTCELESLKIQVEGAERTHRNQTARLQADLNDKLKQLKVEVENNTKLRLEAERLGVQAEKAYHLQQEMRVLRAEHQAIKVRYESRLDKMGTECNRMVTTIERLQRQHGANQEVIESFQKNMGILTERYTDQLLKAEDDQNIMTQQMNEIEELRSHLEEVMKIVRELREKSVDQDRLRTDLVNRLATEKSRWEMDRANLTSQINQLEEQLSSSSRQSSRSRDIQVNLSISWEKERNEQKRLLAEAHTLALDLQEQLRSRDETFGHERKEFLRQMEGDRLNWTREKREMEKKITQLDSTNRKLGSLQKRMKEVQDALQDKTDQWRSEQKDLVSQLTESHQAHGRDCKKVEEVLAGLTKLRELGTVLASNEQALGSSDDLDKNITASIKQSLQEISRAADDLAKYNAAMDLSRNLEARRMSALASQLARDTTVGRPEKKEDGDIIIVPELSTAQEQSPLTIEFKKEIASNKVSTSSPVTTSCHTHQSSTTTTTTAVTTAAKPTTVKSTAVKTSAKISEKIKTLSAKIPSIDESGNEKKSSESLSAKSPFTQESQSQNAPQSNVVMRRVDPESRRYDRPPSYTSGTRSAQGSRSTTPEIDLMQTSDHSEYKKGGILSSLSPAFKSKENQYLRSDSSRSSTALSSNLKTATTTTQSTTSSATLKPKRPMAFVKSLSTEDSSYYPFTDNTNMSSHRRLHSTSSQKSNSTSSTPTHVQPPSFLTPQPKPTSFSSSSLDRSFLLPDHVSRSSSNSSLQYKKLSPRSARKRFFDETPSSPQTDDVVTLIDRKPTTPCVQKPLPDAKEVRKEAEVEHDLITKKQQMTLKHTNSYNEKLQSKVAHGEDVIQREDSTSGIDCSTPDSSEILSNESVTSFSTIPENDVISSNTSTLPRSGKSAKEKRKFFKKAGSLDSPVGATIAKVGVSAIPMAAPSGFTPSNFFAAVKGKFKLKPGSKNKSADNKIKEEEVRSPSPLFIPTEIPDINIASSRSTLLPVPVPQRAFCDLEHDEDNNSTPEMVSDRSRQVHRRQADPRDKGRSKSMDERRRSDNTGQRSPSEVWRFNETHL